MYNAINDDRPGALFCTFVLRTKQAKVCFLLKYTLVLSMTLPFENKNLISGKILTLPNYFLSSECENT